MDLSGNNLQPIELVIRGATTGDHIVTRTALWGKLKSGSTGVSFVDKIDIDGVRMQLTASLTVIGSKSAEDVERARIAALRKLGVPSAELDRVIEAAASIFAPDQPNGVNPSYDPSVTKPGKVTSRQS